ncbi:MAG: hypothetical protein HRT40_13170 [Campylobacteraceae bacterium]|nr:hypothetical protein [Campylobacteraceae bacterium]
MLDKILNYCFTKSKQPVLFKDLLVANSRFNEGLDVDNIKLGYRLKISRTYLVYLFYIMAIGTPVAYLTHKSLATLDTHASIVVSAIFTATVFVFFNFFKVWLQEKMAEKVILEAWILHFPYFEYNEYKNKVEEIFQKAMKEEIVKKDLQRYVLDSLVED